MTRKKAQQRGRRPLGKEVREDRWAWKRLLGRIFANGRRPLSDDIAATANSFLVHWEASERITVGRVNHYCATPEGAPKDADKVDLRVPTSKQIANGFVHALDELGAWGGTVDEDQLQQEKNKLVELLGFELLPRPPSSVTLGPTGSSAGEGASDREALIRYLQDLCGDELRDKYIIHLYSSIGFHTSRDREVADAVFDCVTSGINLLFVNRIEWDDYPRERVLKPLARNLRTAAENSMSRTDNSWKDRLWYLQIPQAGISGYATLHARKGILSRFSSKDSFGFETWLSMIRTAAVVAHWVEHVSEIVDAERSDVLKWHFSKVSNAMNPPLQQVCDQLDSYKDAEGCHLKIERLDLENPQ